MAVLHSGGEVLELGYGLSHTPTLGMVYSAHSRTPQNMWVQMRVEPRAGTCWMWNYPSVVPRSQG